MKAQTVESARSWVTIVAGVFAVSSGIYGAVQAYSLLPITQKQQQAEIDTVKSRLEMDHERLVRIESNVEWIKDVLDKHRISKQDSAIAAQ